MAPAAQTAGAHEPLRFVALESTQRHLLCVTLWELKQQRTDCDLELKSGESTEACHSLILKATSDYFKASLAWSATPHTVSADTSLRIIDLSHLVPPPLLSMLVELLYLGSCSFNPDFISDVLRLLDVLCLHTYIPSLVQQFVKFHLQVYAQDVTALSTFYKELTPLSHHPVILTFLSAIEKLLSKGKYTPEQWIVLYFQVRHCRSSTLTQAFQKAVEAIETKASATDWLRLFVQLTAFNMDSTKQGTTFMQHAASIVDHTYSTDIRGSQAFLNLTLEQVTLLQQRPSLVIPSEELVTAMSHEWLDYNDDRACFRAQLLRSKRSLSSKRTGLWTHGMRCIGSGLTQYSMRKLDIVTGRTFKYPTSASNVLRNAANAVCFFNGFLYLFGGKNKVGEALDSIEKFDFVQRKWTVLPLTLQMPRSVASATVWDDKVLITGTTQICEWFDGHSCTTTVMEIPHSVFRISSAFSVVTTTGKQRLVGYNHACVCVAAAAHQMEFQTVVQAPYPLLAGFAADTCVFFSTHGAKNRIVRFDTETSQWTDLMTTEVPGVVYWFVSHCKKFLLISSECKTFIKARIPISSFQPSDRAKQQIGRGGAARKLVRKKEEKTPVISRTTVV